MTKPTMQTISHQRRTGLRNLIKLALVLFLSCAAAYQSRSQFANITGEVSVDAMDWSKEYAIIGSALPNPRSPILAFQYTLNADTGHYPSFYTDRIFAYDRAATSWLGPYVLKRDLHAYVKFTGDETGNRYGAPSVFVTMNGSYWGVNEYYHEEVERAATSHSYSPTLGDDLHELWHDYEEAVGQNPFVSVGGHPPETHPSGAAVTRHVTVNQVMFAYYGNDSFAMAPIAGTSCGEYLDVDYDGPRPARVWADLLNGNYSYNDQIDSDRSGFRFSAWYGITGPTFGSPYIDPPQSVEDFLHSLDSSYNTTGGKQVGTLVKFDVVPVHPPYVGGSYFDYAFQVAMQLRFVSAQPIFVPLESTPAPPLIHVPPIISGTAASTCSDSPVAIPGVSIEASPGLDSWQVHIGCKFGTLSMQGATGNGTADLTMSDVAAATLNTDLATLTYTPAANFYGMDVISVAVSRDANDSASTMIPVMVKLAPFSGQVSWWRGEGNAVDTIGGNDGDLVGDTSFSAGNVGDGFEFDGNEEAVQVGNPASLHLTGDFSIEAWVKRNDSSIVSHYGNTCGVIFGYGHAGYALGMYDNGGLFLTKIDVDAVSVYPAITDTDFHHIAVTRDRSSGKVVFYVDGRAYPGSDNYYTEFEFNSDAAIGARGDNLSSGFLGKIDEVGIYNRALSAEEVRAIFGAGTAGKCFPPPPPQPPVVSLSCSTTYLPEGSSAAVTVSRTGSTMSDLTVWIHQDGYVDDPACYFDFDLYDATVTQTYIVFVDLAYVTIPAGESQATFYVNATADELTEDPENCAFMLVEDPAYEIDPENDQTVITIYDN